MQVKQRLRINSVVSALAVLAIFTVLFLTISGVTRAIETKKIADEILAASFERLMLRTDSQRTGNERTKEQLIAKHKQVGNLLKAALKKFPNREDRKIIADLLANHESIGKYSRTIRENRAKSRLGDRDDALFRETEGRLLSQLNMRVYESLLLERKLQDSSNEGVRSTLKLGGWGIILVLLLVSAATLINSWRMGRTITNRVGRLRDGAALIGEGDLDHRTGIKGDDEFAEISEAFDAMTSKLRGSYQDLEKEIEERKQADQGLRESEERFRALTMASSDVVYRMSPDWSEMRQLQGREFLADTEEPSRAWLQEYIHPDDQAHVKSVINEAIRTRCVFELEHRVISLDGTLGWTFSRAIPLLDGDGEIMEWFGAASDVTERKRAEEQIKAQLAEKDVMLREIHHRVKNNLQVISSLVSLQADTLADERMRGVLGDVRDRVRAMALVHEKLYQTGDLARLDFAEYTASLLQYLWRSHGQLAEKVRLTLAVAPVALPIEAAVSCGLILNELASNALKHAFPDGSGGEVTVGLEHDCSTQAVCLRVRDNGVGLPAVLDWRQSRSLGLRLVQILAGQLRGTVETGTGPGAEFRVTFPLKGFQS